MCPEADKFKQFPEKCPDLFHITNTVQRKGNNTKRLHGRHFLPLEPLPWYNGPLAKLNYTCMGGEEGVINISDQIISFSDKILL